MSSLWCVLLILPGVAVVLTGNCDDVSRQLGDPAHLIAVRCTPTRVVRLWCAELAWGVADQEVWPRVVGVPRWFSPSATAHNDAAPNEAGPRVSTFQTKQAVSRLLKGSKLIDLQGLLDTLPSF
jgi:hypothetical protein